mmetsp:Transcript_27116/g.88952  ORF Transcript_27116/g.88952 Transcript_27116/m.88952 type:complete len:207 (+) Transcript_27116:562-1182(+)
MECFRPKTPRGALHWRVRSYSRRGGAHAQPVGRLPRVARARGDCVGAHDREPALHARGDARPGPVGSSPGSKRVPSLSRSHGFAARAARRVQTDSGSHRHARRARVSGANLGSRSSSSHRVLVPHALHLVPPILSPLGARGRNMEAAAELLQLVLTHLHANQGDCQRAQRARSHLVPAHLAARRGLPRLHTSTSVSRVAARIGNIA